MKKALFVILLGFIANQVSAQTDEINILQSIYGKEKKALVSDFMKLTPTEEKAFWPVYEKYEQARKELGKTRINNISEYAKNYQSLSNEKATDLVTSTLKNQQAFAKLQQSTFKQMSKAISPARAAQFTQLEMYLDNAIKARLGEAMPFIEGTRK